MPTPRDSTDALPLHTEQLLHSTCPPDTERPTEWRTQVLEHFSRSGTDGSTISGSVNVNGDNEQHEAKDTADELAMHATMDVCGTEARSSESIVPSLDVDQTSRAMASSCPPGLLFEEKEAGIDVQLPSPTSSALDLPISTRLGVQSIRLIQTHTSSMLRPGSKFRGTQQSDSQRYNVEVDIQNVDMAESSICGYLKIEGLTPEHPSLTTFFEGEIIGSKYTFQTRHKDWGATDKDDMRAWARFPAWRAAGKQAKKSADFHYKNSTNRENMFMRWKEKFLVPDHRVREINGASFEGFYYICFNQVLGAINGIYYHSKTDSSTNNKVQQLELKWVNDRGRFSAMEFR